MTEDEETSEAVKETPPAGIGAQLRAARKAQGKSLDDMAATTRIATRHIEHLDNGEFDLLPGRIYAIGFAKTYAKEVGLDPEDVADQVRAEMGEEHSDHTNYDATFEPGDPARAPGRKLLWFSIFAVALLLAGLFAFARELFAPAADLPSLVEQEQAEEAAQRAAAVASEQVAAETPQATGDVAITAEGEAWVRIADGEGRVLKEEILAEGDSYTVPADAENPQISTARPDLLTITIGGKPVPKLAEDMRTFIDEPFSAAALLARGEQAQPEPGSSAAPR
ncbi:helix-turn-helix domain-containing protein [Aurantiacibacter suaedae]|uniref:helix-turn-helix domain-containing protein n=1 Tax=Aurantiacibacter suaedae TaxID=2545755 RepID=UPI0010F90658|nr:helix-turn-helix domain-containing protein [Aurantiacibacter suaedae]